MPETTTVPDTVALSVEALAEHYSLIWCPSCQKYMDAGENQGAYLMDANSDEMLTLAMLSCGHVDWEGALFIALTS